MKSHVASRPPGELDERFSSPGTRPTAWRDAQQVLERAEVYWLTSVRPDGRPHVTPLIGVWQDDAFFFCTGEDERKAKNIARNTQCAVTTGCNNDDGGLDLIVEGAAVRLSDDGALERLAEAYVEKYGEVWRFSVRDGKFVGSEGNVAIVFRVAARKVLAFAKGESFGQTRWRF
jgi:general stress protein 26